jgi:hypothetical protein
VAPGGPAVPAPSSQSAIAVAPALAAFPPKTSPKGTKEIKKSPKILSKTISKPLSKPDGRLNKASKQAIKTTPPVKKMVRMQMGGTYDSEEKAQTLVQRLIQQGGMPSGKRLVIQKAMIRGKAMYRVILIGVKGS